MATAAPATPNPERATLRPWVGIQAEPDWAVSDPVWLQAAALISTIVLPLSPLHATVTNDTHHAAMKLFESLSDDLTDWAQRQPVFFTGSASTHGAHINVSPKGMAGHFAVLGPNQCAYIDRTGSGCETISHAYENGRLCLMFMSFGPSPRIMRLFCRANVIEWDNPKFSDLVRRISKGHREAFDGARAVILCDIWQVQTSCGFAVPRIKKELYAPGEGTETASRKSIEDILRQGSDGRLDELSVFEDRPTLDASLAKKVNTIHDYQATNNAYSMDNVPGLKSARRDAGERLWAGHLRAKMRRLVHEKEAMLFGFSMATLLYLVLAWVGGGLSWNGVEGLKLGF